MDTIKDYLDNIVKGLYKCIIKINGVTLNNRTKSNTSRKKSSTRGYLQKKTK